MVRVCSTNTGSLFLFRTSVANADWGVNTTWAGNDLRPQPGPRTTQEAAPQLARSSECRDLGSSDSLLLSGPFTNTTNTP